MTRHLVFLSLCMTISACGESASNTTPQMRAATACEAEAKTRMGERSYQVDVATLGKNAKLEDGSWRLQAPITIDPGLRSEANQILECKVLVAEGKPDEVTFINFIP
jgi:hypothetical protein